MTLYIIIIAVLAALCGILVIIWLRAAKRADFYEGALSAHMEITENVSKKMRQYNITPDEFNQIYFAAEQQYLNEHYNNK